MPEGGRVESGHVAFAFPANFAQMDLTQQIKNRLRQNNVIK